MDLRNIAIIAHVDHGKTTLVDALLHHSEGYRENQQTTERALDSNDLERERGITILAKCTSVPWNSSRINIVDTPGHADFGGEVERILSMIDGVVLLVDAVEGPMPQTKFVLGKTLALGLRPMVLINKVDRPDQQAYAVHDAVFDLFSALGANEMQLDFPTLFGSAKQGWVSESPDQPTDSLEPLFTLIHHHVPPPLAEPNKPFCMLVTTMEYDPFLGRLLTGRIKAGIVRHNQQVKTLSRTGESLEQTRITKILAYRGLNRVPLDEAHAGDIVALAGMTETRVADTVAALEVTHPLPAQPIDPPTLAMTFAVNDSPLAGQDGNKLTSRLIKARLEREVQGNVAIQLRESEGRDSFEVAGRGELQMAVLIETMRREGFELSISRPRVLLETDSETGRINEPIEEVVIDVDAEYTGAVVEKLSARRAELIEMRPAGRDKQRLVFHAPSRALIGYHGIFLTDTRGTGVMNRSFHSYGEYRGLIADRHSGVLIATQAGLCVAYALWHLEERGALFVVPSVAVYQGMIIGEHLRGNDLEVNPLKAKQLTNIRASGKDEAVTLTPPISMSLEKALTYIADDELVEVTPNHIRLRKRFLDPNERKRNARQKISA